MGFHCILKLRYRRGQIGGKGSVDMRLELREIDFNQLIVFGALIFVQLVGIRSRKISDIFSLGSVQVIPLSIIEREERGRRANLGPYSTQLAQQLHIAIDRENHTHVAACCLASRRKGLCSWAMIFHDCTCAALDCQDSCYLEYDI